MLNGAKQSRDQTRMTIEKIRLESGLLAEPQLLRDMETSMKELAIIKVELENLKSDNKIKGQQIRNIRKNIEMFSAIASKIKNHKMVATNQKCKAKVTKGRSNIFQPLLPYEALNHLRDKKVIKDNISKKPVFKL